MRFLNLDSPLHLQAPSADAAADALNSTLHALASTSSQAPLLLALAEVEASRGSWRAASDAAARAVAAAGSDPASAAVRKAALDARVRACLTAGYDSEALTACAEEAGLEEGSGAGPSLPTVSLSALHAHASSLAPAAASLAAAVRGVLLHGEADTMDDIMSTDPDRGLVLAWAAARAGGVFAAVGGVAGRAAARAVLESGPVVSAGGVALSVPLTSPTGPLARGEAVASLHACSAQLSLADRDWVAAEDAASAALAAVTGEGVGADTTLARPPAAAAAPLLLLGDVFARRAQVTVAEGLYRRAALDAGLAEPSGDGSARLWKSAAACPAVHPSLASTIAWRMAQLLSLNASRATEAGRWAQVAAAVGGMDKEALAASALGPLCGLKGGVVAGMAGPYVDVGTRRVLPRLEGVEVEG